MNSSKPDWHRGILDTLSADPSERSINWLITNPSNSKEIFVFLRDLADLPNVIITSKSFSAIKTMLRKSIEKKCPIGTLVIRIPKHIENQAIHSMIEQLAYGLLIDCRIGNKECVFEPFNLLILRDTLPSLHMAKTFDMKVSAISDYDRETWKMFTEARISNI